jgi:hypothetical protein
VRSFFFHRLVGRTERWCLTRRLLFPGITAALADSAREARGGESKIIGWLATNLRAEFPEKKVTPAEPRLHAGVRGSLVR